MIEGCVRNENYSYFSKIIFERESFFMHTSLEYLINPMGIIRTELELALNYGYPSDDLDKIDGGWM